MCLGKLLCSFRLPSLGVARALVFIGKPAVINGFTGRCFFCVYIQKCFDIVLFACYFGSGAWSCDSGTSSTNLGSTIVWLRNAFRTNGKADEGFSHWPTHTDL